MLVYLDTAIAIYTVEGAAPFQAQARTRLATLHAAGDQAAITGLTELECRVQLLRVGDQARLALFDTSSTTRRLPT